MAKNAIKTKPKEKTTGFVFSSHLSTFLAKSFDMDFPQFLTSPNQLRKIKN
jgi:hypothetical protein